MPPKCQPRTNSPNETLSARAAFRQGRRAEAYRILCGYIDELVEVENMAGASMVGIEFVNMMTAVGRLTEAGVILGHFDSTGLLGVEGPGFKVLITDAVDIAAADAVATAARQDAAARGLDERAALDHMRRTMNHLIDNDEDQPRGSARGPTAPLSPPDSSSSR